MPSMQDIVDTARFELNDDDKERYSDGILLTFAQDGLATMKLIRPDLFLSNMSLDPTVLTLVSQFPLDLMYKPVLQDYVVMRAQRRNDEHVNSGHVTMMAKFFEGRLM
jgi:hypothetical protein